MQGQADAWVAEMGFDENGMWHAGPMIDGWRWAFSDLDDAQMKSTVADLIVKVLLGTDPATLSMEEIEVLSMSSFSAPGARFLHGTGMGWDA